MASTSAFIPTGDTTAGTAHARYCSILNAHFPLAQSPPAVA